MDSKFIKQTIDFIEKSDLNFIFSKLIEVKFAGRSI